MHSGNPKSGAKNSPATVSFPPAVSITFFLSHGVTLVLLLSPFHSYRLSPSHSHSFPCLLFSLFLILSLVYITFCFAFSLLFSDCFSYRTRFGEARLRLAFYYLYPLSLALLFLPFLLSNVSLMSFPFISISSLRNAFIHLFSPLPSIILFFSPLFCFFFLVGISLACYLSYLIQSSGGRRTDLGFSRIQVRFPFFH